MDRLEVETTVGDWTGVLPASDRAEVRRHRIAQGLWRTEQGWPAGPRTLKEEAPPAPTLPNYLAREHDGRDVFESGINLSSEVASDYAGDRVPRVRALGGVVLRDRLYRNLLSSQPLAFSIAGVLRAHPEPAAAVLAELSGRAVTGFDSLEAPDRLVPEQHRNPQTKSAGYQPLEAYALEGIEAEWFPPPWAHTGDRSGFDVAACMQLEDRTRLLVSIEVKYVDTFSPDPVTWTRYQESLEALGLTETSLGELVKAGCSQVLRQVMITESIRRRGLVPDAPPSGQVDQSLSVVLARGADKKARHVVEMLAERVDAPIQFWSLGDFIHGAEQHDVPSAWAGSLRRRYLREE